MPEMMLRDAPPSPPPLLPWSARLQLPLRPRFAASEASLAANGAIAEAEGPDRSISRSCNVAPTEEQAGTSMGEDAAGVGARAVVGMGLLLLSVPPPRPPPAAAGSR